MEQLVLILIIGLISLINWLIQKSAEAREKRKLDRQADLGEGEEQEETAYPQPSARQPDREESMRKLMEALGLPEESPAPEPLPKPRPRVADAAPPPLPRPEYRARSARMVVPAFPEASSVTRKPYHAPAGAVVTAVPSSRVRTMLAQQGSLRDAVILTEILGKPKAFTL